MKDYIDRTLVSSDALTWNNFVEMQKMYPPPGYKFSHKTADYFQDGNYITTLFFERM